MIKVLQAFLENPQISEEEIREVSGLQEQDEELGYFQFMKLAYDTAIVSFLKSFEKKDFADEEQYVRCVILDILYHFLKAVNPPTEQSLTATDEEIFQKMREKVQSLSLQEVAYDESPSFRNGESGFPRSEGEPFPSNILTATRPNSPSILPFTLFGASPVSRSIREPEAMGAIGDTVDGRSRVVK